MVNGVLADAISDGVLMDGVRHSGKWWTVCGRQAGGLVMAAWLVWGRQAARLVMAGVGQAGSQISDGW